MIFFSSLFLNKMSIRKHVKNSNITWPKWLHPFSELPLAIIASTARWSFPCCLLVLTDLTAGLMNLQGLPGRITGTFWVQDKWATRPVTAETDDTHSSIFLPDIIRAMMNDRGEWTGSCFKPEMPDPDSLQGQCVHVGVPLLYSLKIERRSPLTNLWCQGPMKKYRAHPRGGFYDFDKMPPRVSSFLV